MSALDNELRVTPLQYTVQRGEQIDDTTVESLEKGTAFKLVETEILKHQASVYSAVTYDLVGKLAEETYLKRETVVKVLRGITAAVFTQYRKNPEDFILKAANIIKEQKATVIVEHLSYDPVGEMYTMDVFTKTLPKEDFKKALKTNRHVYDYVFTDSDVERKFVSELDTSVEVVVYAKLPRGFFIPTPVGNYNPDWAIAFHEGKVKHVYFVAETKGSMSTMQLKKIEECKVDCARKFFAKITSDQVKYDVVNSYGKLMELVQ